MKNKVSNVTTLVVISLFMLFACERAQKSADNLTEANQQLEQQRTQTLQALEQEVTHNEVRKLVELGLWEEAEGYLDEMDDSDEAKLVRAALDFKKHRYETAEALVNEVLESDPTNKEARLLKADLEIQAWRLDKAEEIADAILRENESDAKAGFVRGRVALLKRDYEEALRWAKVIQEWDPALAEGYLLEGEVLFWDQDPAAAEPALQKALEVNPFNADARFSYGYAVWRRVDATQLDNMAGQWNLAFEVNPLHYLTHWHFGNGHTNLTYADYATASDEEVREKLKAADTLLARDQVEEAITMTRDIGVEYPESVLPEMMRGSFYYMFYSMDRAERLDSAEVHFQRILEKKKNYGPAHNALAAVIKQRQFQYLEEYEELEQLIENTPVPEEGSVFYDVFKDAEYYPGDRVKKMIAQQIGPSKAYLEMIQKFDSDFAIPPLHIDLAIAMDRNYFRYGTTFDNRQWMDIRGVGSGATGIEYLERGAHLERNVLAHEYAHLYHGRILTDAEDRKIRSLYHEAMANNKTLDYYASNNESEFFAQGYAGFLAEKKVHPLNHKSMNTKDYIEEKDPDYYAFLEELLNKQKEYLAGNETVLADNWAQTYLSLAGRAWNDRSLAASYLDTALTYSPDYVPAILEYSQIKARQGEYDEARSYISQAKELDGNYAPVYVSEANILHYEGLNGDLEFEEALDRQEPIFTKAKELEDDLSEAAQLNRLMRERYLAYGKVAQALTTAEDYVAVAPTISTYLTDRKEEAETFMNELKSQLGYSAEVTPFFEELLAQNPQNFDLRLSTADILIRQAKYEEALAILQEGQRILESAGNSIAGYALRIAWIQATNGNMEESRSWLAEIDKDDLGDMDHLLLAEIHILNSDTEQAGTLLTGTEEGIQVPYQKAEWLSVMGKLAQAQNETATARDRFEEALELNPYHLDARIYLIRLFSSMSEEATVKELKEEAGKLEIPLGPDFSQTLN
ncbi:MAG TPA: tetratricopeptide repeat protein [Gracilimonas sp.]|nr:tetratricopeptide repeat protein [Gracilimonas sp.]